jgi:SpoVK/Ycf46/Vps4 family AAA+-type ATPase
MNELRVISENKSCDNTSALENILENNKHLIPIARSITAALCVEAAKELKSYKKTFSVYRARLKKLFGFDNNTISLCELIYIMSSFNAIEDYFERRICISHPLSKKWLATMLGMDRDALVHSMSELSSCGLIEASVSSFSVDDDLFRLWGDSDADISELFCKLLSGKTLPIADFNIPASDVSHVSSLLRSASDSPLHVLLYGPPGTGKTTFAASLARELGLKAWIVPHRDKSGKNNSANARRIALTSCINLASKHQCAFVLLDEADRFLDTGDRFGRETVDKAWINELMERTGVRIIWIVNNVRQIDDSIRRRFTYSIYFEQLGVNERRVVWNKVLKNYRVKKMIDSSRIEHLAREYKVSPAVIENAVRQAKNIGASQKNFADTAEHVIRSYAALLKDGRGPRVKTAGGEKFSLDGICVEGGLDEFLERCHRIDAMKRAGEEVPPGAATILFYGPPGTGKSALAKYLSEYMDRELMVKRASDILSPFVGMSERQIADTFHDADRDDAVLLIDETDSFLYSRGSGAKSWENTMVNEFLTSLEECRVFCICTTNRMDNLDPAALRRFSFKLPFAYAKPDQIESLYNSLLAPLTNGMMTGYEKMWLYSLDHLTPGDFHVVRNQNWLTPKETVSHEKLIAALETEQKVKQEREGRVIGF